jgi:hypothetical protein
MGVKMKRREFISFVGGAVVAWPRAVIAQVSPRRALVAVLSTISSTTAAHWSGFSQGLQELGYVEGRNIDIVYRYGDGDQERLPPLADELVRLKPDVIVTGSPDAVLAVKRATATIPYGQNIGTAEEPVLHRAIELAGAQSWGDAYQSGFRDFPDLPIASRRIGVPRLNLWVCDHAAS